MKRIYTEEYGYFFAFSPAQYEQGYKRLVRFGQIKDGDALARTFTNGLFGTSEGLKNYYQRHRSAA